MNNRNNNAKPGTESSLHELCARLSAYTSDSMPFLQGIAAEQYVEALQQAVSSPGEISQGVNGTCGAAVLCKYLAEKHPALYSDIAISLYESGKHDSTRLKLPTSMQYITPDDSIRIGQSVTDTVMQTAITRSNNMFLAYSPTGDMQAKKHGFSKVKAGATSFMHPAFMLWFIRKRLKKKVRVLILPTVQQLCRIDYRAGFVIALTHYSKWNLVLGMPNHYIQITNACGNTIDYWSWGEYYTASIKKHAIHAVFIIEE